MELVEREQPLAELARLLDESSRGQGRLVFISGEAGIGKTALVETFLRGRKVTTWRGACDPLIAPRPLGALVDIAATTRGELERLLREGARAESIFASLLELLSARREPVVLVLEDVHWADETTLDLLRFLGRRIGSTRALMLVTCRDTELGSRHPLRVVLGDMATAPTVRRMPLSPLTEAAIRTMARGAPVDARAVLVRTSGNPFFVTEVLASPEHAIPDTARDAVLARVARLADRARATLEVAAVIGARCEPAVLVEVLDGRADVETCMASGMLQSETGLLVFRHELAREAIESSLAPDRLQALHARVLRALQRRPVRAEDLASLAHHALGARDVDAIFVFGRAAGEHARALRAHRDAATHFARALAHGRPPSAEAEAEVLEALAFERYLLDQLTDAITARRRALRLWLQLGNPRRAGENECWLSRLLMFTADRDAADALSRVAIDRLEGLPRGRELAAAYANESHLRMKQSDIAESLAWGDRALDLAREIGDVEIEAYALNTLGCARLIETSGADGWDDLADSLALAHRHQLTDHILRGYLNIADLSILNRHLERGRRCIDEANAFALDHLGRPSRNTEAVHATLLLARGHIGEAGDLAASLLRDESTPAFARESALYVVGYTRALRGDPEVWPVLDESLVHETRKGEPQLLARLRAARAAAAWLAGDDERAALEARRGFELVVERQDSWFGGELACWLARARVRVECPDWIAEPYQLQLQRRWREAADAWRALNCELEATFAELDGDDEEGLRAALAGFERMAASAAAARATRRLRELGARTVPRGPRKSTRTNPAGLTDRELAVLQELFTGHRNAEIAKRLHISAKTVDHHISSILAKLDVRNRTEAIRKAEELGLAPA